MPYPISTGPPSAQAQLLQMPVTRPPFAKEYYFLDIELRYGLLQVSVFRFLIIFSVEQKKRNKYVTTSGQCIPYLSNLFSTIEKEKQIHKTYIIHREYMWRNIKNSKCHYICPLTSVWVSLQPAERINYPGYYTVKERKTLYKGRVFSRSRSISICSTNQVQDRETWSKLSTGT